MYIVKLLGKLNVNVKVIFIVVINHFSDTQSATIKSQNKKQKDKARISDADS